MQSHQAAPDGPGTGAAGALSAAEQACVSEALARLSHLDGALLPILHAVQDALGYVPPAAVAGIGRQLNLSRAEVHGVLTFYHHFRSAPPGRHVLQLCRAEACQAMGAATLARRLRERAGLDFGQTTADGALTLEAVYCLGQCACAPAALLDGEPLGRLDAGRLDQVLERVGGDR